MTEHLTQQADVIAELDRILESEFFASTGKISRLLRFVVTETLAGRAHQIKESIIGVEVYQRRQDYDPKTDAIVRVEAGRLRARLDQYYASLSQTPALRIQLPKGTYVPVFVGTQPVEQPAEPKPASAKQQRPLRSRIAGIALGVCIACIVGVALLRPLASRELPFSITVLPTRALGTERSLEVSAPGFSEQVAAKLSSRSGILVATHPSGAPQSDALLETAIQQIGSQLIVTAKLIRRSDGSHLWSQTYTSESTDFARFQDLAAELLTRTLWMNFAGVPDPFSRVRQRNAEALRLYVKGRAEFETGRKKGAMNAVTLFEKAVELDPAFAEAHGGLAAAAWFLADFEPGAYSRRLAQARTAATTAMAIEDRVAEAHSTLGNILLFADRNLPEAERELRRAVELAPGLDFCTRWYSLVASMRGHQKRAADELEFARLINPSNEQIQAESARIAFELNQVTQAETFARRALALAPRFRLAHYVLGRVQQRQGDFQKAAESYRACGVALEWDIDCQAALAALPGSAGHAAVETVRPPTWTGRALVALTHGKRSDALRYLERASERHECDFAMAWFDDRFAAVRSDAMFSAIWRKSGMQLFAD